MDFKKLCQPYEAEALAALQEFVNISSVYDETTITKHKPFGEGVDRALSYMASLATAKGLAVDRCDGYCTEITFGKGPRIIGVYAHADVVPAGGLWRHDPFQATIEDGRLYARGASDDKGPAIAAFYALLALDQAGLIDEHYQVRLVIGGNEERGSTCLAYYFEKLHKPYPHYGFTPDSDFPLIYGEKGIANYQTSGMIQVEGVHSIQAGVIANSVIDKASARVSHHAKLRPWLTEHHLNYDLVEDGDEVIVTVMGKAAHGAVPQEGVNAGLLLLEALAEVFEVPEWRRIVEAYRDPFGRTLDSYYHSELLKDSTYNVGIITYEEGQFSMVVNFRFPEQVDAKAAIKKIGASLPFTTTILNESRAFCFDPQSPMIQGLLNVYQEETGDYETPIMTIGGGTYAKESRNTIAFGSAFPGRIGNIHEADEYIEIADLYASMPIYAHGVYFLGVELCD